MDQEDTMDFKALRAKFQDEELLLKQPRIKPALPDKPKVVPPPPQSPPHYLPAGARPSLLTSINQSLEGKSTIAPRVVFKDEKKEKKPFVLSNPKKSDSKPKEKKTKDAELVPATPPPKATPQKKKGLLGLLRTSKRLSTDVPEDPILDTTSSGDLGPAPLIPVPSGFTDSPTEVFLPNIPTSPDPSVAVDTLPPFTIPTSPDFAPPPAFIPEVPTPQAETLPEIETPEISPPVLALSSPPPEPETQSEAVAIAAPEQPPPDDLDPESPPPSPKRPISALSALSRAEDMNPGKKTPADQRILNALEKARRKTNSPHTTPTPSYSITPPPEELPRSESPARSFPELPPIDYEERARKGQPPKPAEVNGFDHRQASPVLEGITEEGSNLIPEMLVVPPPPPRKLLPDPKSLGPAPEKPDRPPSVHLNEFMPPPAVDGSEISGHPDFSETDTTDIPEFDDVASDAHSPELPVSEWSPDGYQGPDEYQGTDGYQGPGTPHGQFCGNGISIPGAEIKNNPPEETSFTVPQDSPPQAGLQAERVDGVYESTDNVYEDVSATATKKKGKTDGKKRKGPPKNPYVDAAQEAKEEKSKISRFSKGDKKASAEGPDEKELKKKEKQRLEKEKKELKEKQEREKKEQKEREKKENEMKKKFKITGQEEAMYEAKVKVTTKGRKNDLPVKSGDIISIIRTTNCPKGKWLARDSSNNYGHVAVDHVELDIQEMLELGKKAAIARNSSNNIVEPDVKSTGSRVSNHYPLSAESFTDDSEEWTGDDEDLSPHPLTDTTDSFVPTGHSRTLSMPDMAENKELSVNHQHSHSDIHDSGSHVQARHEALQKLATFFHAPKPVAPPAGTTEPPTSPVQIKEEVATQPDTGGEEQQLGFDQAELFILPPPDLYADLTVE